MIESAKQITELGNIFNALDELEARIINVALDEPKTCLARIMIERIGQKTRAINDVIEVIDQRLPE